MRVVQVDSEDTRWDSFVEASKNGTSYHRFKWKQIIAKSFKHQCYYLAAIDENGDFQGILPLVHLQSRLFGSFMVSVPFVNYGGLLSENDSAARLLLDEAERLRHNFGATHVELRHLARGLDRIATRQHKVTMFLELAEDVDSQWRAFDAKLRNQVRKAEKSGLKFVAGHLELLEGFYEVFARNMRDLGTPVYTKHFFRNILEAFPETTRILAVYYRERMIAAGIASWFRDTLEIPWASSINDYKSLCPNNMLYWQAIRFAIERGLRRFDFGRSTPHEGTYNFKRQWGALPVQLYWQYLMDGRKTMPDFNPSNPKYKAAISLWKRLPVPLTKMLGPTIVRNIP